MNEQQIVGKSAGLVFVILVAVVLGWLLPLTLGIRTAQRKHVSPLWMLFGIHPLSGWIAFIILACIQGKVQCPTCGGYIESNFRLCPCCHNPTTASQPVR